MNVPAVIERLKPRVAAASALLCAAALGAPLAAADDTEIFFTRPAENGSRAANVMFMFDTSGSMLDRDNGALERITRLKQAMLEVLETSDGVNIGLGSFNGELVGGAILYPATDPDADVCPGSSCDRLEVRAPVRDPSDDAIERPDRSMDTGQWQLELVTGYGSTVTRTYSLGDGADDATQHGDLSVDLSNPSLAMFHRPDHGNNIGVGFRFPSVDVPDGATILDARVHLHTEANAAYGRRSAYIVVDSNANSPPFSALSPHRPVDRGWTATPVYWPNIELNLNGGAEVSTPDITRPIAQQMGSAGWTSGDPITVLIGKAGLPVSDDASRRAFQSFEADPAKAARLEITYSTEPASNNAVGLRFADLDIPRGATITHATVEFIAKRENDGVAAFTITGEDIGDAATYGAWDNRISDRARTTARVPWNPSPWRDDGRMFQTSDIGSIVQEIVNRNDWCGGNALALMIEGSGRRLAAGRDGGPWEAPVLRVGFDPSTIDYDDTCLSRETDVRVAGAIDDASETQPGGVVTLDDQTLTTKDDASSHRIGLRFTDVDVPAGATISRATLTMTVAGGTSGPNHVDIAGQRTGYAAPFASGAGGDIGSRTRTTAAARWKVPKDLPPGSRVSATDLTPVVQEIVGTDGWAPGNALALVLSHVGGSGQRVFAANERDSGGAATLEIEYQLDGDDLGGTAVPLRTARDEMRDIMLGFRAKGGTPLVDAYYEAASYLLGKDVDFGRTRGTQSSADRFHRTSHELSWAPGSLYRPPACTDVDPNNVACLQEEVPAGAKYIAPVAGACQVNQIVLLSDGSATTSDSEERIRNLTGSGACDARTNGKENCGVELASWLNGLSGDGTADDPGRVITHTVGFNFSGPFLEEVANAGGGRFQTAASAPELANVFKTIVNEAAELNSSFVAPAASVNRFNRLTNSDDIYFAMFKPGNSPRWDGNLKRYGLNADPDNGETTIVDTLNRPIFDAVTGEIRSDAQSWWIDALPGPDGAEVAAGGAAHQIPSTRTLKTFLRDASGDPQALVPLHEDQASITTAALGIVGADASYRGELLRWARGVDVRDVDGDGDTAEVRHQIGDPLHSTPVVLHYGTGEGATSRVFFGTNQGYLHAIDTASGAEAWGVVPGDLLQNLPLYFENETGAERRYGLDGPLTAWFDDDNDNLVVDGTESATLVVGMRRGGRRYYAFDVSDPDSPSLKWTIEGGSSDFPALGQSWSRPVRTKMLVSGTPTDVLLFAGGYDPRHDTLDSPDGNDTMGQAIYIVEADTGDLVDTLDDGSFSDMDHAIPGDPNVIDIDFDGMADMVFVGDMGGQLWRFDIDNSGNGTPSFAGTSIAGGVVADLNGGGTSGQRRFYASPDVALIRTDDGDTVLNVAIGSGWRAHPLDDVVEDRFYAIRQTDVFGPPRGADGEIGYATLEDSDLFDATSTSGRGSTSSKLAKGWYIELGQSGEKVLASALTLDGTVLFTTYLPDSGGVDECSVSVGGGRLYKVDARYGDAVENLDTEVDADADDPDALTADDRWRSLRVPGIPTSPTVYVGSVDPDAPIVATGDGTEDSGLGGARERTYWVEQ